MEAWMARELVRTNSESREGPFLSAASGIGASTVQSSSHVVSLRCGRMMSASIACLGSEEGEAVSCNSSFMTFSNLTTGNFTAVACLYNATDGACALNAASATICPFTAFVPTAQASWSETMRMPMREESRPCEKSV